MFVGHYAAAFLAKRVEPTIPLWVLFGAVVFVDLLWPLFVFAGVERVNIVMGLPSNPLDLEYMPYSHSLVATGLWSGLAYLVAKRYTATRAALVIALAVASHWGLDWLVHRPDLPLWGDRYKQGLELWNRPALALGLELVLLGGATAICLPVFSAGVRRRVLIVAAGLALFQISIVYGPTPSAKAIVVGGVFAVMIGLIALARRIEYESPSS